MGKLLFKDQKIPYSSLQKFILSLDFDVMEEWEKECFSFIKDWLDPKITHFNIPTSGSTGKPKNIKVSKEDMILSANFTLSYLNLKSNDTSVLCLPAKFIGGKMMIVRAIVGDLNLNIVKVQANPIKDLKSGIDFIALTPYQFQKIIEEGNSEKLKAIDKIIIGGGNLAIGVINKTAKWENKVYLTYGMTESLSHIAMVKLNPSPSELIFRLINERFKLSVDKRGCLVINSPYKHLSRVVTNDQIELIDKSSFRWRGRLDNVINSGGIKILPEELELKLHKLIDAPFFLAGLEDELLGQKLVLLIEKKKDLSNRNLLEEMSVVLSDKYLVPKEVFFLEKFCFTENDKIDRSKTLSLIK